VIDDAYFWLLTGIDFRASIAATTTGVCLGRFDAAIKSASKVYGGNSHNNYYD